MVELFTTGFVVLSLFVTGFVVVTIGLVGFVGSSGFGFGSGSGVGFGSGVGSGSGITSLGSLNESILTNKTPLFPILSYIINSYVPFLVNS